MGKLSKENINHEIVDFKNKNEIVYIVEAPGLKKSDFKYIIDKNKYGTIVELNFKGYGIKKLFNFDVTKNCISESFNNKVYRLIIEKE